MKRVTLVRHGQAEPEAPGGDFYRALDERGRREVARAAEMLAGILQKPDAIVASAAVRTRETASLLKKLWVDAAGTDVALSLERRLYHAEWEALQEALHETGESLTHLLLVGHNPGISELAARWAKPFAQHANFQGFGTAGWCSATFAVDTWSALTVPSELYFPTTPR